MKKWRDVLVDGLLLAVPLIVLGVILARTVRAIAKVSAPISAWLPDIRWLGVTMIDLVAVVILVLLLMMLGAFANSAPGRRISDWLERVVLRKIPGFLLFKSMAGTLQTGDGGDQLVPVLVNFDDNTVLGFMVERAADEQEQVTVFVPSAPTPAAGTVFLVARERIRVLDVPLPRAMGTVTRLGVGLKDLLKADAGRQSGAKSA